MLPSHPQWGSNIPFFDNSPSHWPDKESAFRRGNLTSIQIRVKYQSKQQNVPWFGQRFSGSAAQSPCQAFCPPRPARGKCSDGGLFFLPRGSRWAFLEWQCRSPHLQANINHENSFLQTHFQDLLTKGGNYNTPFQVTNLWSLGCAAINTGRLQARSSAIFCSHLLHLLCELTSWRQH